MNKWTFDKTYSFYNLANLLNLQVRFSFNLYNDSRRNLNKVNLISQYVLRYKTDVPYLAVRLKINRRLRQKCWN